MNFKKLFSFKSKSSSDDEDGIFHSTKLKELSRIIIANRDLDWDRAFMAHAGKAHLACRIPQIEKEGNGFSYFQLEIPDTGKPFQSYTIESLIEEHLLKDGLGAAIRSYDKDPDMIFSYGELLNYHFRKTFRSNQKNWIKPSPNQFDGSKEIIGGNPSPIILPEVSRKVLLKYFVKNNIHFPKISFLKIMTDDGIMNQLVFNIIPKQFIDEKHFQKFLSSIAWYLPMHYTYTSIPQHYLGDLFFDL